MGLSFTTAMTNHGALELVSSDRSQKMGVR